MITRFSLYMQWCVLSLLFRNRKPREDNFISLTQFPWLGSGWVANKLTGDFHFSSLTWLLSRGPRMEFHTGTFIMFEAHFFVWRFFSMSLITEFTEPTEFDFTSTDISFLGNWFYFSLFFLERIRFDSTGFVLRYDLIKTPSEQLRLRFQVIV